MRRKPLYVDPRVKQYLRERYLKRGGEACPVCLQEAVSVTKHMDDGDGEQVELMKCNSCGATWADELDKKGELKNVFGFRKGRVGYVPTRS